MNTNIPFTDAAGYHHIVYRTHNLINGKEYTGKHSTDNLNDGYYGSGSAFITAVNKHGLENFAVEFLSFHYDEMSALIEEESIVDEEYIWREDTYNCCLGGQFNWYGMVTVKDKTGNILQVSKYDPEYLNGNLVGHTKDRASVKDRDGNTMMVSINDPRYLSGELVGVTKGLTMYKDKDGNTYQTNSVDTRVISNELISFSKGKVTVKDKSGNTMSVSVNDPRYLSGELVGHTIGQTCVKDKDGNKFMVFKTDPRYLSGELVPYNRGLSRTITKVICPHCGKTGAKNGMARYHFDNCKFKITIS